MSKPESIPIDVYESAKKGGKVATDYAKIKEWFNENYAKRRLAPSEKALKDKFGIRLRTLVRHARLNDEKVAYRTVKGMRYWVIVEK